MNFQLDLNLSTRGYTSTLYFADGDHLTTTSSTDIHNTRICPKEYNTYGATERQRKKETTVLKQSHSRPKFTTPNSNRLYYQSTSPRFVPEHSSKTWNRKNRNISDHKFTSIPGPFNKESAYLKQLTFEQCSCSR